MKYQIFAVYDTKADAYMQPFLLPTKGMAIRTFTDEVNKKGTQLNTHPEDYTLFHLGEWEDGNCEFFPFNGPRSIGTALEFLSSEYPSQDQIDIFKHKESVA